MKIVVFGPQRRVGALASERVIDLNRADPSLPSALDAFIAMGEPALERARTAIERAEASGDPAVAPRAADVELHAPWPRGRIACAGGNYGQHLLGMAINMRGEKDLTLEKAVERARSAGHWGFWKVAAEVAGPDGEIPYPSRTQRFDYEGEAAIVIGKRGKRISADRIADHVWGVTLLNDWSIRDGSHGPARPVSYNLAKNFDGCASLGPCIVVGELDPQNVAVQTTINGELRQSFNTREMIFSFGELLEYLSYDLTFVPGDVLSGGTNAGTAADSSLPLPDGTRPPDKFLKRGDVVEVSSPQIGTLRNRIV